MIGEVSAIYFCFYVFLSVMFHCSCSELLNLLSCSLLLERYDIHMSEVVSQVFCWCKT